MLLLKPICFSTLCSSTTSLFGVSNSGADGDDLSAASWKDENLPLLFSSRMFPSTKDLEEFLIGGEGEGEIISPMKNGTVVFDTGSEYEGYIIFPMKNNTVIFDMVLYVEFSVVEDYVNMNERQRRSLLMQTMDRVERLLWDEDFVEQSTAYIHDDVFFNEANDRLKWALEDGDILPSDMPEYPMSREQFFDLIQPDYLSVSPRDIGYYGINSDDRENEVIITSWGYLLDLAVGYLDYDDQHPRFQGIIGLAPNQFSGIGK